MNFSHATIYIPILFLEKKTNQKENKTRTLVPRGTNRSAGAIVTFKLALYR